MTMIRSLFGSRWLLVPVAVLVAAMAFAITGAEASGDEYGDSATPTGGVDGVIGDVLHAPDGAIVQIGTAASGGDGSVTVSFVNNVAFNGPGPDIRVPVGDAIAAALAPATATIEVSADGVTFVTFGEFTDTDDIDLDLDDLLTPLPFVVAVRITQPASALPEGEPGGFDLDAVER